MVFECVDLSVHFTTYCIPHHVCLLDFEPNVFPASTTGDQRQYFQHRPLWQKHTMCVLQWKPEMQNLCVNVVHDSAACMSAGEPALRVHRVECILESWIVFSMNIEPSASHTSESTSGYIKCIP